MSQDFSGLDDLFNFQRFKMQYPEWMRIMATKLLNEVIIDEIHRRQEALGFSKKIIQRTYLGPVNIDETVLSYTIISDYTSDDGFDVAAARELGTRRHWIAPVKAKALSWIQNGVRRFSLGHFVSGINRSNVIKNTREEFESVVQERMDAETDKFYLSIMEMKYK